ncbi:DISARM system phospholipase D-like protein DrmC [Streptomyces bauhiniae]|uniref:DISARM system phospholipase D-like protein DrmC n=1 Tax=Streptomyces bauhiniae TaxID=2340725 RepID=UPI0036A09BAC
MPGHLVQSGPLTTSVNRVVDSARHAITCSTFNFQRSSALWKSLREAAQRDDIAVRVYMDARAADGVGQQRSPTTAEVAAHLAPAEVWRTKQFDGTYVRSHAKVLAIDHHLLLVTSANFSWSAENNNVEFGVLIDNPNLAEAVERELREAEGALYERISDVSQSGLPEPLCENQASPTHPSCIANKQRCPRPCPPGAPHDRRGADARRGAGTARGAGTRDRRTGRDDAGTDHAAEHPAR